jgi:hypothetical protein
MFTMDNEMVLAMCFRAHAAPSTTGDRRGGGDSEAAVFAVPTLCGFPKRADGNALAGFRAIMRWPRYQSKWTVTTLVSA